MTFRVIQCPGCGSTFNAGPGILEAAAGRVRCGACLEVFDAAEQSANPGEGESVFVGADSIPSGWEPEADTAAQPQSAEFSEGGDFDHGPAKADGSPVRNQQSRSTDVSGRVPGEHGERPERIGPPLKRKSGSSRADGRALAWTALSFLLMLVFIAQVLWREMDSLGQLAPLRPLYRQACALIDCALPDFSDIAALRVEEVSVRSHPEAADGLLIDLTVVNTAAFPQDFPILVLSFSEADDSVIALREFAPREYLQQSVSREEGLPAGSSQQVTLGIVNPGTEVIKLTVSLRFP